MSNIGSYDERFKDFAWEISETQLEYKKGDVINIGAYCTDRICHKGKGEKLALIWQGHSGEIKKYSFAQMRILTNTIAQYLLDLGIKSGDRV